MFILTHNYTKNADTDDNKRSYNNSDSKNNSSITTNALQSTLPIIIVRLFWPAED